MAEEKDFVQSALDILLSALEKLAAPLLLASPSVTVSSVNTLLFRMFSAIGNIFPQSVKVSEPLG